MAFCKIAADGSDRESVQIKLLCGSDVLESFAIPGLWTNEDVSYDCIEGYLNDFTYSICHDIHMVLVANVD